MSTDKAASSVRHTVWVRRTVIGLVALVALLYIGFIVMMGWR